MFAPHKGLLLDIERENVKLLGLLEHDTSSNNPTPGEICRRLRRHNQNALGVGQALCAGDHLPLF